MMKTDTTAPEIAKNSFRVPISMVPSPNVVNMVDSNVNIDTHAATRFMVLDAEYTGLLYLRYFTIFMMARVIDVKVYAAKAIVVIS